jgi:hypothetical protein
MRFSRTASMFVAVGVIAAGVLAHEPPSHAAAVSYACPAAVGRFVDALANVDGQLDVGINFATYRTAYTRAHVAYSRIPVQQESYGCLQYVGVPAENALNAYAVAYNIWSKCIATYGCNINSPGVNRRLQFRWAFAHRNLQTALNNLAP